MVKKKLIIFFVLLIASLFSFPVYDPFNTTIMSNYSDTPITFFTSWYSAQDFPVNIIDTSSGKEYLPFAPYDPVMNSFFDRISILFSGYFFHFNETLAWNIIIWFNIFLFGFSVFYFCRMLTKNEIVSLFSAVMSTTFGYFLVESRVGHLNTIYISAILFSLIAIERLSLKNSRRNFLILVISFLIVFGLDFLLAINIIIVLAAYVFVVDKKLFKTYFSALIIVFILSLPFLIPVFSHYLDGGFERGSTNLIFLDPIYLMPGQLFSLYILLWSPVFVFYISKIKPSRKFMFFSMVFVVYFLISTQEFIYNSLSILIPLVNPFRAIYRLIILAALSVFILFSLAISELIEMYKPRKTFTTIIFFLLFVILFLEKTQVNQNLTIVSYEKPEIFDSIAGKEYTTVFYPLASEEVDWNFPNLYYEPLYYYFITLHNNKVVFRYVGYYESSPEEMAVFEEFFDEPSSDRMLNLCSLGVDSVFCSGCNRNFLDFVEMEATSIFANQNIKILTIYEKGQEREVYLNASYFYELNCSASL